MNKCLETEYLLTLHFYNNNGLTAQNCFYFDKTEHCFQKEKQL